MASSRDIVVFTLRKAADVLEAHEGWLRLPGWEDDDEAVALRAVARAIAGDGVDPDVGTDVPMSSVSELVQYLADILEE
ncbi:MAG: hypothetical protein KAX44_05180 [Candidatus Brocadiae bacterium]|nr:hypothetical protein [Candidatus Brocadiia bacterium]